MALKQNFRLLTTSADELNVQSGKLGKPEDVAANTYVPYTIKDIGKPVTMGTQGNFYIAEDGGVIDGFIDNVDGGPTADGLVVGGVARVQPQSRYRVKVAGESAIFDTVSAGVNQPADTANEGKLGVVKVDEDANDWRIIAYENDDEGGQDLIAIIERI